MLLRATEPGIRLAVGLPGSGKTYGVRQSVEASARAGVPVIVVDRCFEWNDAPADIPAAGAASIDAAARAVAGGARLVIVRPRGDGRDAVEAACRWAMSTQAPTGIAIPEAHEIAPLGSRLSESLAAVVAKWRHFAVLAWFDSQRLAKLETNLVQTAFGGELRVYAQRGPRDLAVVRDFGGHEMERAVITCAERHARAQACCSRGCARCAGDRGWYVTSTPPYEPRRG